MAQENVIKTRFQLKHDIQSHWEQATNFIPRIGEPIVYDVDENNERPRIKIGDGQKTVNELPFVAAEGVGQITIDGGEIFNDYQNGQAYGEYSHVENFDGFGGYMGFRILGVTDDSINDGVGTYILDSVEGIEPGQYFSVKIFVDNDATAGIQNKEGHEYEELCDCYYKEYCGNIISVDRAANSIVVNNFFCFYDEAAGLYDFLTTPPSSIKIADANKNPLPLLGTISVEGCQHVEGHRAQATGHASHAEGHETFAEGHNSHTEGKWTKAVGLASHAEGQGELVDETIIYTKAIGNGSHAEGRATTASGLASHSEGYMTISSGMHSHAEGRQSEAVGVGSHAEGAAHSNGQQTQAIGTGSHAEGRGSIAQGNGTHAEGSLTMAKGSYSHAEGRETHANGDCSHSEGTETFAIGLSAHSEGNKTNAIGDHSHSEGTGTKANGNYSHAEGNTTRTSGRAAHAEGEYTVAVGTGAHAEGAGTARLGESITTAEQIRSAWENTEQKFLAAVGHRSHAEGLDNLSYGANSHTEGRENQALNTNAHAEGMNTIASGHSSHTEGRGTSATGNYSHAEGQNTTAGHLASHAEGFHTVTNQDHQHVQGRYNEQVDGAWVVGNGSADNNRKNAAVLDWDGNLIIQGNIIAFNGHSTQINLLELFTSISKFPSFTAADEGKFLRIIDGAPAWATVPNAEEASF